MNEYCDALIGHTGFVGGSLVRQHPFAVTFNSANIGDISGACFETVVCAAAPGSMLQANRAPERDHAAIEALTKQLRCVEVRRFVLISSIAVLAEFAAGDDEGAGAFQETLAYGRHRRMLEAFCETHFEDCLVVRLPALFGPGLRKNFIFDLMNPVPTMLPWARLETLLERLPPELRDPLAKCYAPDSTTGMLRLDRAALDADPRRPALDAAVCAAGMSAMEFHNPDSTYQYYDMARLWADIGTALDAGLRHIHLAVAPLRVADIHARLLGAPMLENDAKLHHEDMRTRHAELWGHAGPYLEDADTVLDKLAAFYAGQRPAT